MVFTVLAAVGVNGTKLNYELDFAAHPTLQEFQAKAEQVFAPEVAARRPPEAPHTPFTIHRMQVFDDTSEKWVDLSSGSQLVDFSQVYIFQRETPWHKEVQSKIPPAVRPPSAAPPPPPLPPPPPSHPAVPVAIPTTLPPPRAQPAPTSVAQPVPTSVALSFGDKVRGAYEELAGQGPITVDAFAAAFARVRLDLPEGTVREIFNRIDIHRGGELTFSDFQRFGEMYPTILDSLYYRSQDYWIDVQQQEEVLRCKQILSALREKEAEARVATRQVEADAEKQEQRLRQQEAEVRASEAQEEDAKAVLRASQQETQRATEEVLNGKHEIQRLREEERAKKLAQDDAMRRVEMAKLSVEEHEREVSRAMDRLHEIERLLSEQHAELDRRREMARKATTDLAMEQVNEKQTGVQVQEAQAACKVAVERQEQLETHLEASQARERDCIAVLQQARDETVRKMAQRDMEERELVACRERVEQRKAIELQASQQCDEQQERTREMESINLEHNIKRRQVEEKEKPLLDQEVRLRNQRETLEAEEAKLRDEHRTFHTGVGRIGPVGVSPRADAIAASLPVPLPPLPRDMHPLSASSPRIAAVHHPSPTRTYSPVAMSRPLPPMSPRR